MKPVSSLLAVCLFGILAIPAAWSVERKSKEIPLLTDAERANWPFTPAERERSGMPSHVNGAAMKVSHSEFFRYRVWMGRHPEWEPVGISFRPDEDFPVDEASFLKTKMENKKGESVPLIYVAQSLSTFSNKFVLVSARVEKHQCEEYKASGLPEQVVARIGRNLEKQGITVLAMGLDTFAVIESPDHKTDFTYDRSRAAEYERDRERWFNEKPRYVPRGLIYQPTGKPGAGPFEFRLEGEQIRHLAAALAKLTQKEVFVQPHVEKREFELAPLQGSREQILAQLDKHFDRADVRLIELGPDALAVIQE